MTGFPMNIVEEVHTSLVAAFAGYTVVDRPLRPNDPAGAIGIFANDWIPRLDSFQIGQREPALQHYEFSIHNMVKNSDESTGRKIFALDAKTVRVVLYRDADLLVRLKLLQEDILGVREHFQKLNVSRQRMVNNEIRGVFIWVATTSVSVDTESIQL